MINYNQLLADVAARIRAALPLDFAGIEVKTEIDTPQENADNIAIVTMASMTPLDIGRPAASLQNYTMTCNIGISLALNPSDYPEGAERVRELQWLFSVALYQVAGQLDITADTRGFIYYAAWLDPTTMTVDAQSFVATYNIIATVQF